MTDLKALRAFGWAGLAATCILSVLSSRAGAQKPQARIIAEVDNANRIAIPGSALPRARADNDAGRVPEDMKIQGMSFVFSRSEAQSAALETLIAAQQNPSSALYHQWLTPDQFASRFGAADQDIAKVESWLQQEGFTVDAVSRSRDRITFSGTAVQVETAFGTPIHYFTANGETHFAPLGNMSLPAAFSASVLNIGNVSNFRPKPRVKIMSPQTVQANFTSSMFPYNHFVTPKDVATIYDINAAYNAGYTGTNQSIAIVGQSSVVLSDISNFQTAAGLTVKAPTTILVPGSGTTAAPVTDDEVESDLDLEYAGGIAKGATIYFVYTGNNQTYGVFDSLQYAVSERLAPIISSSYGECETALGTDYAALNAILQQAATQGQTIIAASGDSGSTDCYEQTTLTSAQRLALGVDFPASSQYVTGLGGTEFTAAAVDPSNTTYWTATTGTDVISSALSYMPEMVWNDDPASKTGASSGGGGISQLTARPTWQTGVTGIPSGSFRLVPDISLASSPNNAGYLYCSSDTQSTGITGSCSNGFRDSTTSGFLTVAGGTSFAAPIFAGMLAIINQSRNSTGQGVINPTLYTLASNSTTYATAFHDTTSGGNQCTAPSVGTTVYCNATGASAYAATLGYDEASGLGSVDLNNLLTAWPTTSAATLQASSTTLSAATLSPVSGAADVITITVAPASTTFTTTPTGSLTLLVDGATATSTVALTNGVGTYTFTSPTAGAHVIQATYSGDSVYASSTGSITLSIGTTTSSTGTFTVTASSLTVAAGSSGSTGVTVTPAGGYTGTVAFTLSSNVTLTNACYTVANVAVPGTSAVTATLTVATSSSLCAGSSVVGGTGMRKLGNGQTAENHIPPATPSRSMPIAAAFAGLLAFGLLGRQARGLRLLGALVSLGVLSFGLSGCGGSGGNTTTTTTTTTSTNATKGTYTLSLKGSDSASSTITASTTFTLTID